MKHKIILSLILAVGVMGFWFYINSNSSVSKTDTDNYYQKLRQECESKDDKNCCLASVDGMKSVKAKLKPKSGCKDGQKMNGLLCISSYRWCENDETNSQSNIITTSKEYYESLKNDCKKQPLENIQSCCLDSVKAMEVVGGFVIKGTKVANEDCAEGYERMTLRCPGSYAWCQTDLDNGINDQTTPNVPKNEPMIAPQEIKIEQKAIVLPKNVITEKECSARGGEVWNTLGETSYNGELIGKIVGLDCPCACLMKEKKGRDILWVNLQGFDEEFKGDLNDIKTYDDCKKAGFKILNVKPEICQVGEPEMTGGKYKTFTNNPIEVGKNCTDYHYSNCPGSCVATCKSSSCSNQENGTVICTSDCDGAGSCTKR